MEATALEARSLTKTYRSGDVDVHALRGVGLSLGRGEFVAVMGPSGSGKSTLLHLLGGLERPTAGEILVAGRRIDSMSETKLARLRRGEIGFVFQFFNLVPSLTVAENVELPSLLAGRTPAQARARRDELLGALGLSNRASVGPAQLSGGEQQRVALARALVNRPTVVLADEPTGNLDSASAREVLQLLRGARRDGQSILLVTHDARVAAAADRVITLRDGAIVDETQLGEARPVASLLELEV
jgi:putative ABC transport system ATP-binding protein